MIGLIAFLLSHILVGLCFYFLGLDAGKKLERIRNAMKSLNEPQNK
jgi:hypothetical protein